MIGWLLTNQYTHGHTFSQVGSVAQEWQQCGKCCFLVSFRLWGTSWIGETAVRREVFGKFRLFPQGSSGWCHSCFDMVRVTDCFSFANVTMLIHVVLHLGFLALSQASPNKI